MSLRSDEDEYHSPNLQFGRSRAALRHEDFVIFDQMPGRLQQKQQRMPIHSAPFTSTVFNCRITELSATSPHRFPIIDNAL